jgi:poly-gamma-glutamate synthesis protein (capsule biosynthesis protein)
LVHWGVEYTSTPTQTQTQIAGDLVSTGADVIVGSHPHWVQTIYKIDGKPIFYSLGNFVFDQPWSEETKKGLIIRLTYKNGRLIKIDRLPTYMQNLAQPQWVN